MNAIFALSAGITYIGRCLTAYLCSPDADEDAIIETEPPGKLSTTDAIRLFFRLLLVVYILIFLGPLVSAIGSYRNFQTILFEKIF